MRWAGGLVVDGGGGVTIITSSELRKWTLRKRQILKSIKEVKKTEILNRMLDFLQAGEGVRPSDARTHTLANVRIV
jgi:hypothetical protein